MRLLRTRAATEAAIVAAGNFTSAGLRFAASVMLARALGPEHWGYLVIFSALTDLVAVYADSGISTTTVRFLAGPSSESSRSLTATAMATKSVVAAIIIAVCWIFAGSFLLGQDIPESHRWVYIVACAAGLLQSMHNFALSLFQARQRFVAYSFYSILINVIRVAFVVVALYAGAATATLFAAFYVPIFVAVVVTVASASWSFLRVPDTATNTYTLREFIVFLIPLGVLNFVTILLQRIDVFMINAYASPAEAGIYGLAYQVAFVFPLISSALFRSLLPRVSAMKEPARLRRYLKNVLHVVPVIAVATVAGAAVLPFVIPPLLGDEYRAAAPIVSLLVVAFGINVIFNPIGLIFYAFNKPYVLTLIHITQLPILVLSNIILIPLYQSAGAAYSGILIRIVGIIAVLYLALRQTKPRTVG